MFQFIPHGHCYLWQPQLVWLHIISDSLIALSYYSISIMLVYFVYKRRDIPFKWIFLIFGVIVACGTSHIMEVWTLWHPTYWLSGSIKAITAIISLYAAVELYPLVPQALALSSPAQLETTNQKLAQEVNERTAVEVALRESEARFKSMFTGAAVGIALADMAGIPVETNPALQKMLGYSESEFRSMCFTDFTHSEDINTDWQLYQELMAGQREYYQLEKRYICKDRQIHWAKLTVSLVRDDFDQPQFAVGMVEDITERKQAEAKLQHYQEHLEELVGRTVELTQVNEKLSWQASHDALTGLINRRGFEKRLEEAVLSTTTSHDEHTLCYLDLDRFKSVNDTCGHIAGDELLRQIGILLKTSCRRTDVVARLGGDEFGLLLHQCSLEQALQVAHSLHEKIQSFRFVWQNKSFSIGVSIGLVAISNSETHACALVQSPENVLNAADVACYTAKKQGRNRLHVYQADDRDLAQQRSEIEWIARLNQALASPQELEPAENQFRLYYQPILPLTSQAMETHYEVLLRLIDDTGTCIAPMAFLPAAERYNLMPTVDRWVIRTFFAMISSQSSDLRTQYAINLSGASVNDEQFIDFVKEQFAIHQISPQLICFEITETVAIANLSQAAQLIHKLRTLGCRFALDDFGSGMSSFAYLKHLPVDYLKIDGDFVKDIVDDPLDGAIVEAINHIGHLMGLQTIAEFVTNETVLAKIKSIGVDYAQGYAIAAPRPISELKF